MDVWNELKILEMVVLDTVGIGLKGCVCFK